MTNPIVDSWADKAVDHMFDNLIRRAAANSNWEPGDDPVILVDESDIELGVANKIEAHLGEGALHRAFMVILHDGAGNILPCRRSGAKLLWPSIWADSCASHPRPGETVSGAAARRLTEELGVSAELTDRGCFIYQAPWGSVGSEHELCYVLTGKLDSELRPNPGEISELRWTSLPELLAESSSDPDSFAPWLMGGLERIGDAAEWQVDGG